MWLCPRADRRVFFSLRFVAVCVEGETETFSLTRDILSFKYIWRGVTCALWTGFFVCDLEFFLSVPFLGTGVAIGGISLLRHASGWPAGDVLRFKHSNLAKKSLVVGRSILDLNLMSNH